MCGRYFRRSDKQRIAEAFRLGVFEDLPLEVAPSYNIAPTTMQPVIRNNRDTGEREMVAMRWGMVPHFAKSLADFKGFSTINTINHQTPVGQSMTFPGKASTMLGDWMRKR